MKIRPHIEALEKQLCSDGYLILPRQADDRVLDHVTSELSPHFEAASFGTGAFYGSETKRFGRVLQRSKAVADLVLEDTVMQLAQQLLLPNCDCLQLSFTQGIEIHPGAPAQGPHRDQDMWRSPKGAMEYMINVMWALDDFTEINGATRIWPRSNNRLGECLMPDEEAVSAVMPAGSACLFLGSTLHSGGANRSPRPRRGLIISYCLGWLKPWENQWLSYPPEVAQGFPPELSALVGYQQHRPALNNFEGQCPSVLLDSENKWKPFVDALQPEQSALVEEYRRTQLEARAAA